jgi:hypothetical protein
MRGTAMSPRIFVVDAEREADDIGIREQRENGPRSYRPPTRSGVMFIRSRCAMPIAM